MDTITSLFDRMNAWRHLPNYQLERRADLFFSLYLPEVLAKRYGGTWKDRLIPEFPIRKATIGMPGHSEKSVKADYLALTEDLEKGALVELKTEMKSLRPEQDEYLGLAANAGFKNLVKGILKICQATSAQEKYYALLEQLFHTGLIGMSDEVLDRLDAGDIAAALAVPDGFHIRKNPKLRVVYVQPKESPVTSVNVPPHDVITFSEFRDTVCKYDDVLSQRFARSLDEWADVPAGELKRKI